MPGLPLGLLNASPHVKHFVKHTQKYKNYRQFVSTYTYPPSGPCPPIALILMFPLIQQLPVAILG